MKILIPVDGSKYSRTAVEFVASRSTLVGANPDVEILNVQMAIPTRATRVVGREVVSSYYTEEAEKALKPARTRLQKAGVEFAPNDERLLKEFALFADRSDVSEELTRLGNGVLPHLRRAAESAEGEQKARLTAMLDGWAARTGFDDLRLRRAARVLRTVGTPEARERAAVIEKALP